MAETTNTHYARIRAVAWLMLLEAATLAASSGLHLSGAVTGRSAPFDGTHAGIAEAIIALILTAAALTMFLLPRPARRIGIAVNTVAIAGFLNGLNMTIRGGHLPDIAYHLTVLPLLIVSVLILARARPAQQNLVASASTHSRA